MFAVYATHAAPDDPLSALKIGDLPDPTVPEGWVRVKVSHASLNRHDLFTLRGISGHPEASSIRSSSAMTRPAHWTLLFGPNFL